MPRLPRAILPDCPQHVTQRGNNRQDVFFVDDDRRTYLDILFRQSRLFGLAIEGYCLMTNHIHLIAVPSRPDSLAKALGRTDWRYTQYVNRFHERTGHLWQNRLFSCAVDDAHWWTALCYVELNPVRAGLVRRAREYEWSSAGTHCRGGDPGGLLDLTRWRDLTRRLNWKECPRSPAANKFADTIRRHTATGRPLGTDGWLAKMEVALGRRLRALPIGRPRKPPKKWRL